MIVCDPELCQEIGDTQAAIHKVQGFPRSASCHCTCAVTLINGTGASLVPRPHPSLREGEGLVKNGNIPGPEAGIWESQSDPSICN